MTEQLAQWYEQHRSRLESRGIRAVFEQSPEDRRGKRSAWLIVQDDNTGGQVTVWDTGECQLVGVSVPGGVEDVELRGSDDLMVVLARLEALFEA